MANLSVILCLTFYTHGKKGKLSNNQETCCAVKNTSFHLEEKFVIIKNINYKMNKMNYDLEDIDNKVEQSIGKHSVWLQCKSLN